MANQKEKYSALERLRAEDAVTLKKQIDEFSKKIKELMMENEILKKENNFLTIQFKFKDQGKGGGFDLAKIAATSTPHDIAISPAIIEEDEEFNNEYLKELKGEENYEDIRAAAELQKRNSKYPPHLRDSYAVQKIDVNMNEEEIKHGGEKTPLISSSSYYGRKKDGTNYRRPSLLPTPSKNARPSIGSSNTLRDASNTNIPVSKTPSKVKQIWARMSLGKDEVS